MIKNPSPMHPGRVLQEVYISEMNLNQTTLAQLLDCSPRKINEIVNGKRGISADFALVLEKKLKTTANMWVRMQAEWDLHQARMKAA